MVATEHNASYAQLAVFPDFCPKMTGPSTHIFVGTLRSVRGDSKVSALLSIETNIGWLEPRIRTLTCEADCMFKSKPSNIKFHIKFEPIHASQLFCTSAATRVKQFFGDFWLLLFFYNVSSNTSALVPQASQIATKRTNDTVRKPRCIWNLYHNTHYGQSTTTSIRGSTT